MRIIAPLVKLGLGGGAIYLLYDQKVFSHSQKETIEAYKKVTNLVSTVPGAEPILKKIPKPASKDDLKQYWNAGVKISIEFLSDLPQHSKDASHKGFTYMKEELQKQMKSPENSLKKA